MKKTSSEASQGTPQMRKNQAAIALLKSWQEGNEQEQRETLACLKHLLGETDTGMGRITWQQYHEMMRAADTGYMSYETIHELIDPSWKRDAIAMEWPIRWPQRILQCQDAEEEDDA